MEEAYVIGLKPAGVDGITVLRDAEARVKRYDHLDDALANLRADAETLGVELRRGEMSFKRDNGDVYVVMAAGDVPGL